ncbi:MAG: alpha-2-macroglobulin family protein, partial [Thermodesulfobacteriota bacterium]
RHMQPAPRVRVQVEAFERRNYTVRKRLVGGFYGYDYVEDTRPLGTLCRGRTRADGTFRCERRARASGNVVVQVTAYDADGRASVAHQDVWVAGDSDFWFRVANSDRMDVLPDRKRYEPGDVARLQVRMPFRHATALVTTAREGVLDARVVELSGKNPVLEVPVTDAFSPNMFVSVLAVRGRVGDVQPTARVDLGKPAFKLGVAELVVGWRPHELDVEVTTDRETYRVREEARARIVVRTAAGEAPPPGATVALAAVDEGLLELAPNESWHLLRAMMGRRGFGVWTSTGQMEVIGKRHYGLKARPQGGGGGRSSTRELFDTLLLWRADVALDASGAAEVPIPLNDSLTSFRVVAVATGGTGLFGDGAATIRTTQDLMLFSGLPPVVRSGDRFRAELTVRNTTERALDVELRGKVEGLAGELAAQVVTLAPSASTIASWDVAVPDGVTQLGYAFEAQTAGGGPVDRLRVVQRVAPAVPVRVTQGMLVQIAADAPFRETVAAPAGALAGQGGIELRLAPSLLSGLDGPRAYMQRYPYTCLEQRVSRGVVLDDPAQWSTVVAALPAHFDGDGFLAFFPGMADGSELLTAYVLLVSRAAGLALPDEVVDKMERALRGFVDGSLSPGDGARRRAVDLPLRKLAVLAALASGGELDPALVGGIPIEPGLWPASTLLDWWTVLARTPAIERRDARLAEVQQALRARLELGGTTLGLRSGAASAAWSVFAGGDTDALRLVLLALDAPSWRPDAPKLVRAGLALQERGSWDTTIANAWGALATRAFARAFEGEPVGGEARATLAATSGVVDWTKEPAGGSVVLRWPAGSAELAIEQRGPGRPWASVLASAAIPLEQPVAVGYRVTKEIAPLEPRPSGELRAGDVLTVRLEIDAQADRPWVVLDDPVPGGSSHLRTTPARAASAATAAAGASPAGAGGALAPTFVERSFQSWKAYFEELPAGKTVVSYA